MFFQPAFGFVVGDWWLGASEIDLDFVNSRYHKRRTLATDLLSCSRASIGYAKTAAGTLTQFPANALRITDLGLLVEDARTNLLSYSQDFSQAAWTLSSVTLGSSASAPDGTSTATKILTAAGNNQYRVVGGGSVSAGKSTASGYFKAADYNYGALVAESDGGLYSINVDLTTGDITDTNTIGSPTNVVADVEPMGDGWYRLSITLDQGTGAIRSIALCPSVTSTPTWHESVGSPIFDSGAGGEGIYIWGGQLEDGAFPSSYIPTTTAAATRAAETVTCLGNLATINAGAQASLLGDIEAPNISGYQRIVGTFDAGVSGFGPRIDTAIFAYDGVVVLDGTFGGGVLASTGAKVAMAWDATGRSLVGGGGTVVSDANPNEITNSVLGAGDTRLWGYIRRLTAWTSRLADATLQDYTDPDGSEPSGYAVDMDFVNDTYTVTTTPTPAAQTVLMLHCDGADGSTNFSDSASGHFVIANGGGNTQVDTAQSKFGGASILFTNGSADWLILPDNDDFAFGTGDFTVDMWVRFINTAQVNFLFSSGALGANNIALLKDSDDHFHVNVGGADAITGTASLVADTWYHVAVARSGSSMKLFVDGTQDGSTYTASDNLLAPVPRIGVRAVNDSNPMKGWIDEFRILKGAAAWTANFTPPSAPYDVGIGPYDVLTCSRASIGYAQNADGTLTQFAANQLRITDLGLLVEDTRTNYIYPSADFSAWTSESTVSVTTDQATAPDGTATMDQVSDSATTNRHIVYKQPSTIGASGTVFTFSVFVKDVDRRYVQLVPQAGDGHQIWAFFDLQTGTLTDSGVTNGDSNVDVSFVGADIEALGDGIYRLSITGSLNSTVPFCGVSLGDRATHTGDLNFDSPSYLGTGKSIYVWGAQVEAGAFPSSYIPTTTASAARAADVVTVTGVLDSVLAGSAASLMLDVKFTADDPAGQPTYFITRTTGNISLLKAGGGQPSNRLFMDGGPSTDFGDALTWYTGVKVAFGFTSGVSAFIVGGGGDIANSTEIQAWASSGYKICVPFDRDPQPLVRRLTAWNTRLADATLQALTSP